MSPPAWSPPRLAHLLIQQNQERGLLAPSDTCLPDPCPALAAWGGLTRRQGQLLPRLGSGVTHQHSQVAPGPHVPSRSPFFEVGEVFSPPPPPLPKPPKASSRGPETGLWQLPPRSSDHRSGGPEDERKGNLEASIAWIPRNPTPEAVVTGFSLATPAAPGGGGGARRCVPGQQVATPESADRAARGATTP